MKEELEMFMDWLWLNHNILTDADKNKVALEKYLKDVLQHKTNPQ